jgi:hypothetical protein
MILTTDLLKKHYGSTSIKIINEKGNFRYIHLFGDGTLKVAAFTIFENDSHGRFNSIKGKIIKGLPIGSTVKDEFPDSEKIELASGILLLDQDLMKKFSQINNTNNYKVFQITIPLKQVYLFCKTLEIYSQEFYSKIIATGYKCHKTDLKELKDLIQFMKRNGVKEIIK